MKIFVNGEEKTVRERSVVSDLLTQFELTPPRVAIEVNENLVPRASFGETRLEEGDRVEIVTLVGGG